MKSIFTSLAGLLCLCMALLLTAGCASKAYLPTLPDSGSHGTVTLIRTDTEPAASKLHIYSGQDKIATLRNNSTVTFSLPVGVHRLSVDWPDTSLFFENRISVQLKAKEHRYIAVSHVFHISNLTQTPRRQSWKTSEMVTYVDMEPDEAQTLIQDREL